MSKQPYAHLKDGTRTLAVYDIEGEPLFIETTWRERRISTDGETFINLDVEGDGIGDIQLDAWPWCVQLVASGIIEELIDQAKTFLVSGLGPIERPEYITGDELERRWQAMSREEQLDELRHARLDPSVVPPAALLALPPEVLAKWYRMPRTSKQKAARIIRVVDLLADTAAQHLADELERVALRNPHVA
ncbi:hypothetical protein F8S13_27300 [Chloroflexia bacterium SDU3-3]|nr:hypothetical protein F8S13_27300 [Chloroflexia bacterium SDU3-3]